MALTFPDIGPVAFTIPVAGLPIRWYALAYLTGFIVGWRYVLYLAGKVPEQRPNKLDVDDFLSWGILGVILGGRIGYILFYDFGKYAEHPLEMVQLWHGGMSFHGGAAGMIIAMMIYAWRKGIYVLRLTDWICCAVPIGLFFGRLANFVNGELFGRVTTSSIGMIFPNGGPLPRHPSQLYEAALEGFVLFSILCAMAHSKWVRERPGIISGVFLIGYAISRIIVEFFRQPDVQLGFIIGHYTMGQLLSVPMIIGGLVAIGYGVTHVKKFNEQPGTPS